MKNTGNDKYLGKYKRLILSLTFFNMTVLNKNI